MSIVSTREVFGRLRLPALRRFSRRRALLACGVVFPVAWIGMDIAGSLMYSGYSYRDQTISENSAIGAPTRPFWLVAGAVDNVLALLFAGGTWLAAGRSKALRATSVVFAVNGVLALALGPFSSMSQRAVLATGGGTFSDTLHLVLVGVNGVAFLAESVLAAAALGRRFRLYTAATVAAALVAGLPTGLYAGDVSANQATPWLGIIERTSAYSSQLWVVVLAAILSRRDGAGETSGM